MPTVFHALAPGLAAIEAAPTGDASALWLSSAPRSHRLGWWGAGGGTTGPQLLPMGVAQSFAAMWAECET